MRKNKVHLLHFETYYIIKHTKTMQQLKKINNNTKILEKFKADKFIKQIKIYTKT